MNSWQGLSDEMKHQPEPKRRAVRPEIDNPWGLTPAQCAAIAHYAEGLTAAKTAKAMNLDRRTVESHLQECRKRMGTSKSVVAAIAWDRFRRGEITN